MILRNTVLTLYSSVNTARIEIFTLIQRENQPSLQRHKQLLAISFATNFSDAAFSRFFAAVSAEILRMIFIIFTCYEVTFVKRKFILHIESAFYSTVSPLDHCG